MLKYFYKASNGRGAKRKPKKSQNISKQNISEIIWSMQQKEKCVEKLNKLKSVAAVKRW